MEGVDTMSSTAESVQDIKLATLEIYKLYIGGGEREQAIAAVLNRIGAAYGYKGLCTLCTALVMAATPPEVVRGVERGMAVRPMVIGGEHGHPSERVALAQTVGQFIAAVTADDTDMAIAHFKAHVQGVNAHSIAWLSMLISITCNTIQDGPSLIEL